ncbi:hypothetical protein K2Y00_02920 [Patescibacteria group bacterium]|nr:hypothetical protein [Patescibacteria group bacterium]
MTDHKKSILALKPFPAKSYAEVDLDRLAVYALYTLDQKHLPLYFEYAAVALFRLFPKKFSMANFSRYPDTYRINNSLRRLVGGLGTKSEKAGWVSGSVEHGFRMTDVGIEIAKQMDLLLKAPAGNKPVKPLVSKTRGRFSSDDVKEIRASGAFDKWQTGKEINGHEFLAFLKAPPYTPKHLLAAHLTRLKDSALTAKDGVVIKFLAHMEQKFKDLIN